MASSQSVYSNEEAHQTALKILMETTADVHFIFESNNNSDSIDFATASTQPVGGEMDDGVAEVASQKSVILNLEMDDFQMSDGELDAGETSDGAMKTDGQETIGVDSKTNDDEMASCGTGDGETCDGEMGNCKAGGAEMNEGEMANREAGAVEISKSKTGEGIEEMDSQDTVDLNAVSRENEIVKIPAHKQVLAALSPVFNAEFNGPLKEQGSDIKMVGASPSAFSKFLQFFYCHTIDLTMDSVEEVMNLIDRYDVATAWPICVEYLRNKLTVDDILWGLFMAKKFRLDDLKVFCINKIGSNCAKVCGMIELGDNLKPKLRSNPNNRPLSDADLADIFQDIFATVSEYLSNPSAMTDQEIDTNVIPFTLITGSLSTEKPLDQTHYCTISSNRHLWLTHLDFSSLRDEEYEFVECNVKIWIQEKDQINDSEPVTLFTHSFKMTHDDDDEFFRVHIKPHPIEIKPNIFTYRVYAQISPFSPPVYAKETIRTNRRIEIAPNTIISFINPFEKGVLASAMFFRPQQAI